jgi:hypothetical protein
MCCWFGNHFFYEDHACQRRVCCHPVHSWCFHLERSNRTSWTFGEEFFLTNVSPGLIVGGGTIARDGLDFGTYFFLLLYLYITSLGVCTPTVLHTHTHTPFHVQQKTTTPQPHCTRVVVGPTTTPTPTSSTEVPPTKQTWPHASPFLSHTSKTTRFP